MKMKLTKLKNPTGTQKLLRQLTRDGRQSQQATGGYISDGVNPWVATQCVATAHGELTAAADGPRRWEIIRQLVQDWTRLRRSDRALDRVQLAREHLELQLANAEARKEKEFRQWLKRPDIQEELFPDKNKGLTRETIEQIERELNLL